jgi:Na+/H+ antiporter NhaD/arsenite permease-like protein
MFQFDEADLAAARTIVAGLVFLVTYTLIATERLDKTLAALAGGVTMIVLGIIDQEHAFAAIDFNVIFLLAGMMILAGILRHTGFFQWVAIRAVKLSGGEPYALLLILSLITAILSAFLDNVTTVVLIGPVTLYIATTLRVSPLPFLISEIIASNIGGTATLIGDPPNILIGSASGLDFTAFLVNMAPAAILSFAVFAVTLRFLFRGELTIHEDVRDEVLALDEREVIADPHLLRVSVTIITLTIIGFLIHGPLGYEPATIALLGAVALMILARIHPEEAFREVEWQTLFFFIGLFMAVEGIVEVGIIEGLAQTLLDVTGGDQGITTLGLLWLSAIASAIIDNIPYTATVIPLVADLGAQGLQIEPLWWALALGACLGGNATIIGASANVVMANMAAKAGHPISFGMFARYGILVTFETLLVSTVYVWFRYLA